MSDWTILKTIEWTTGYLEKKGVKEARLNAEHLIAHALKLGRMDLYLQFERGLSENELSNIKALIKRRAAREPLQHIIGTQPFRNVDIKTGRGALIPRPETEILVEEALKMIPEDQQVKILDIGTGSGAIAAAIAHERKDVTITAIDVSPEALGIAKENIEPYKDRVTLIQGDLFGAVAGMHFDIIVSNPPYIALKDWRSLEPEVRDHEPKEALQGGEDGLDFYRRILNDAPKHLAAGGSIIMELGDGQAGSVKKLIDGRGGFTEIKIVKDLNRKDRVLTARYSGGQDG